jgi:galactokinase
VSERSPAPRSRLERVARAYGRRFGGSPSWVGWGPGRVNIIGEHTDYNHGLAMPAAIDRWVVVAASAREDRRLVVRSEDFGEELSAPLHATLPPSAPSWQRFVVGCVAVLAQARGFDRGVQAVVTGDVPLGAGLSSSAALELALLHPFAALIGETLDPWTAARLGQRVEHEHLGLASGLLDQLASGLSQSGRLMVVDFGDLSVRPVCNRLEGWAWLVVDSGVRRELAGSAYRERVAECAAGLAAARRADPGLVGFRGLTPRHLGALAEGGLRVEARRLEHLVGENARVRAMQAALAAGDGEAAGALLLASHASLAQAYQVSCPELDRLVERCAGWSGCVGARMIGGGFGGCVLALVRCEALSGLVEHLAGETGAGGPPPRRGWRFELVGGAGAAPWPLSAE